MSSYYGVQRSSEYLAHYGVKGMKWGVRRAIEKGNMVKLADHYQKALYKQHNLKEKASRKQQKELAKNRAAAGGMLLGAAGLGGLATYGSLKAQHAAQVAAFPNSPIRMYRIPVGLITGSAAAAGGGLAALGSSAASAYRATKHGNKRAVAKYNRFNTEMNKTFTKPMRKKINKFLKQHPDHDWYEGYRFKRG